MMVDASKNGKMRFLSSWIGVNLVGWIIGIFSGLCLGEFYLAPIFALTFDVSMVAVSPLFVWLPHGASVGCMQLVLMKKWKIQPVLWVIATSLGWGIPATLISWYHENVFLKQFGYGSQYEYWYSGLVIVLVAASVGLAQMLVMGNTFAKRGLWILANVLGFILSVLLVAGVLAFSLVLLNALLPSVSIMGERDLDSLMWVVLFLTLPLASINPSLGTGLYLLKYGPDRIDGKDGNPTSNALLNPQAG